MYGAGFDAGPAVPGAKRCLNDSMAALCDVVDQETRENATPGAPPGAAQAQADKDAHPMVPPGGLGGRRQARLASC